MATDPARRAPEEPDVERLAKAAYGAHYADGDFLWDCGVPGGAERAIWVEVGRAVLDAITAQGFVVVRRDDRPWSVIDLRDVLGVEVTDDDATYAKDILRKFWVPEVRKGRGLPRATLAAAQDEP